MSTPERVPLAAGVSGIATERGVQVCRELSGDTQEIVAVVEWGVLDQLRALRPSPFLHIIAGADR